jgi:hypothetical protein
MVAAALTAAGAAVKFGANLASSERCDSKMQKTFEHTCSLTGSTNSYGLSTDRLAITNRARSTLVCNNRSQASVNVEMQEGSSMQTLPLLGCLFCKSYRQLTTTQGMALLWQRWLELV